MTEFHYSLPEVLWSYPSSPHQPSIVFCHQLCQHFLYTPTWASDPVPAFIKGKVAKDTVPFLPVKYHFLTAELQLLPLLLEAEKKCLTKQLQLSLTKEVLGHPRYQQDNIPTSDKAKNAAETRACCN